jgi:hypothetical protein
MSINEAREDARRAIAKELDRLHRKHLQQETDQLESSAPTSRRLMHRLNNVRSDRYFT